MLARELPLSTGFAFDAKDQVRTANDIVDVVGSYLQLRRQGRSYVGLCPWHDDTRPSMQVNQERQTYKCWVCNEGGDVFSFVMRKEGIEFREALELLADRAGISLTPTRSGGASDATGSNNKKTLYDAMAWAQRQYHECLLNADIAEPARQYLEERGISGHSMARYSLGFAPGGWHWLLDRAKSTPYSTGVLQAVGLAGISTRTGKPFDFFRGRIMFPICDTQARTIAFGARILPELADNRSGKYVNSTETRLFSKSDQLYGLNIAQDRLSAQRREAGAISNVLVVEGYTDVIMVNQHGVENVVALLGTALGSRHIRLLRRYADRITLVLDGDAAGQKRVGEILELFVAEQMDLRIATLPENMDPCDFIQQRGPEALQQLTSNATDALAYKVRVETANIDIHRDLHAANQALENILKTIASAPRLQANTTTELRLREQQMLNRLSREFRIQEDEIRQRLTVLRRSNTQRSVTRLPDPEFTTPNTRIDAWEQELLEILVQQPELIAVAAKSIRLEQLQDDTTKKIYAMFCQFHENGVIPQFDRMLTHLEQPALKHLLVDLDERSRLKAEKATEDPVTRLTGLIQSFHHRKEEHERRQTSAALQDESKTEQEKIELLQQLYEKKRDRQCNFASTDG
ncbi:MAG: DNA primase [Planctomycetaceae bacterium]|nr:DNA primase [Planctomycetaceae bacterium]